MANIKTAIAHFKRLFFLVLVWVVMAFTMIMIFAEQRHQTELAKINTAILAENKSLLEDAGQRTQVNRHIFMNTQADVGEIKARIKRIEEKLGIKE
jgi:hypothetical protein